MVVEEKPYLLEFVETPQLWSLCEALAVRMNSSSCSTKTAGPIAGKSREKVVSFSLKLSLFLPFLFLFLSPSPLHPTIWSKLGQVGEYFLPHVSLSLAHLDYLIPLFIYFDFHPIPWCHMSHMAPLEFIV